MDQPAAEQEVITIKRNDSLFNFLRRLLFAIMLICTVTSILEFCPNFRRHRRLEESNQFQKDKALEKRGGAEFTRSGQANSQMNLNTEDRNSRSSSGVQLTKRSDQAGSQQNSNKYQDLKSSGLLFYDDPKIEPDTKFVVRLGLKPSFVTNGSYEINLGDSINNKTFSSCLFHMKVSQILAKRSVVINNYGCFTHQREQGHVELPGKKIEFSKNINPVRVAETRRDFLMAIVIKRRHIETYLDEFDFDDFPIHGGKKRANTFKLSGSEVIVKKLERATDN